MAKTTIADISQAVAVLDERIDALGVKLSDTTATVGQVAEGRYEDRVEFALLSETVRGLDRSVAALQTRLADSEKARHADHVEIVRLREEVVASRKDAAEALSKTRSLEKENADLKQELAVLRQQLSEHLKRVEVWDARRWGLITLMAGAMLSLASGLVVALARR